MRAIAPQRFVLPIRCLTLGAIRALGAKTRMGCRTPSAGKSTFLRKTGDRLSATAKAAAAWSGFQGRTTKIRRGLSRFLKRAIRNFNENQKYK